MKRNLVANSLVLFAMALLVGFYYLPIWWVSLTAPNYPPEAFPDGVRIHFHVNGVFNGCEKVEKPEITEVEALDCVHEMDTINHYVGMYPIAAGGVLERAFSPFLVTMLLIMLAGFTVLNPRWRGALMVTGFTGLSVWMGLYWFGDDGLKYQSSGYLESQVRALDQDATTEAAASAGQAVIERLRESLRASGIEVEEPAATGKRQQSEKMRNIEHLHETFVRDMERRPATERKQWDGSGKQLMAWHYEKSLARYFNVAAEIKPMVAKMSVAGTVMFWALVAAMLAAIMFTRRNGGPLYWLLIVPAILLPFLFLLDYSAWLWWYGHTLNDMGAFSVKPFMPTVFGDGKVAQFTTHSYPHVGFAVSVVSSLLLVIAANQRYKYFRER